MMPNRLAKDRPGPKQNAILAALPAAVLERMATDLELVPLELGQVLYASGEIMSHAYFPIDSIVSILYVMQNGDSAEIAIIGNDGIVGVSLFLGGGSTQSHAIVQNAGHAYRLKAQTLESAFKKDKSLRRLLLLFASILMAQMVQTAACNRHHPVHQQLCRWMLLSLDRLPSNRISMTPQLIGNMLGISIKDVVSAARGLEKAKLIHYDNGRITVLDRAGLERRSCECYRVVRNESDRLMPLSAAPTLKAS